MFGELNILNGSIKTQITALYTIAKTEHILNITETEQ